MAAEQFDVVILGSGQGGKLLAWHLGRSGKKVAVVERRWVGGSCPAVACMPSKNEIWSARIAHLVRTAEQFGTPHGAAPPTPPGIRVAYHGGSTGLSRWRSIESGETKGIEVVVAQG